MSFASLAWADPIFAQGRYCLQYKHPPEKGLVSFTGLTGTDTFKVSIGYYVHHMVQFESTCTVFLVETCLKHEQEFIIIE